MRIYLVKIEHPLHYAKTFIVNAVSDAAARAVTETRLNGTRWVITVIRDITNG